MPETFCNAPTRHNIGASECPVHRHISERVVAHHAVRPSDLDSLGHVNNATVLEYLEHGRWAWLAHFGIDKGEQIIPVVARVAVDYYREIFLGDFTIETTLADKTFYKVLLDQSITVGPEGERHTAVNAKVHIAFIDSRTRKPRRLRDFLEENRRLSRLENIGRDQGPKSANRDLHVISGRVNKSCC